MPRSLALIALTVCAFVSCDWPRAAAQFETLINVPPDTAPASIGSSTQLNLLEGGLISEPLPGGTAAFVVGAPDVVSTNAELNVIGGKITAPAEVFSGGVVNVMPATPSTSFDVSNLRLHSGATLNVYPNARVQSVSVHQGAVANVYGGETRSMGVFGTANISGSSVLRRAVVLEGGEFNFHSGSLGLLNNTPVDSALILLDGRGTISGGFIDNTVEVHEHGELQVTGGVFRGILGAKPGGRINIAGGAFDYVATSPGAEMRISGFDFRLDGKPVAGLVSSGDVASIDMESAYEFSGILADGTPFVFSYAESGWFSPGTLFAVQASPVSVGPQLITAPQDSVPYGIRSGQKLIAQIGAVINANFNAGEGSEVVIHDGVLVEGNFEAIGAVVNIFGGIVGGGFGAFRGSEINVFDGMIHRFQAHEGSDVTFAGGKISSELTAFAGSKLRLVGREFFLDGSPIEGVSTEQPLDISGMVGRLTGLLADGSPFSFKLDQSAGQRFNWNHTVHPGATVLLSLAPAASPLAGDFNDDGLVDAGDLSAWTTHFGNGPGADANGDGRTDGADFLIWQRAFANAQFAGVPEPSSFALAILLAAAGVNRFPRRIRQRR